MWYCLIETWWVNCFDLPRMIVLLFEGDEMSTKMLTKVAPDLTDEVLGTVVIGMVEDGEMSISSFGAMARVALGASSGNLPVRVADGEGAACCGGEPVGLPAGDTMIKTDLPLSAEDRAPFRVSLYAAFNKYFTRSVSALSDALGLTENGIIALVLNNGDFDVVTSRGTGSKMIKTTADRLEARADTLIYDSFDTFNRRSLGALARITGLTEYAVLNSITGSCDFRVSVGRDTGRTFVSVGGL